MSNEEPEIQHPVSRNTNYLKRSDDFTIASSFLIDLLARIRPIREINGMKMPN
jgi:hypothetical protein